MSYINVYWFDLGRYTKNISSNVSGNISILLICGFYPVIEELSFRLPLIFKPVFIKISGILLLFLIIFNSNIRYWSIDNTQLFIKLAILVLVGGLFFFVLKKFFVIRKLEIFWKKRMTIVYYCQIALYTFMHIVKFELTKELLIVLPIFLLPYFLSGLIFSYVRLRFNTLTSILLHISLNSTIVFITAQLIKID
jgi:hypothetical protein